MKKCKFCAEEIQDEALICKHCGRDQQVNISQEAEVKRKRTNTWIIVVVAVVISCLCIGSLGSPGSDEAADEDGTSDQVSATQQQGDDIENTPTAEVPTEIVPTEAPLAPPIEEILENNHNMTDVQRNRYNDSLVGNRIDDWLGVVLEVNERELLGRYSVYVDVRGGGLGPEVTIEVDEETALSINKGATISFNGTIRSVGDFMGTTVYVENAVIRTIHMGN
nr:hypothetical protein [Anaerolineae bacterium]